jgi:probable phosphoglycerate mutase
MSRNGKGKAARAELQVTRVILVRHGETDWNVIHRLQGITDTKLTRTGLEQAERVAHRLASKLKGEIAHVYSSDLSRAVQTADHILKAVELESLQLDERLREFDIGIFAGNSQVRIRLRVY